MYHSMSLTNRLVSVDSLLLLALSGDLLAETLITTNSFLQTLASRLICHSLAKISH